jgi:hypothetical protein
MSADYPGNTTVPSTPIGNPLLGQRNDTAATVATTNGNWTIPQFDSAGSLRVTEDGGVATYYATSQFACDSTATDIAIFAGSASCVARLLSIMISSTATAAATGDLSIIRRSVANTAGTAVNASVAKADTRDGTANITPQHYTAHPTALGTSAGTIWGQRYIQPAVSTTLMPGFFIDFRQYTGGKGLRVGAAVTDIIAVNIPAALGGSGNAWDVTWCWIELPTTA